MVGTSGKFDRFTERAREVVRLADGAAREMGHAYIGTEHLLLGILREGDGVAGIALGNLGVAEERARAAVVEVIGTTDETIHGAIGLTPRSKKTIELGVREAKALGHNFIGTEHLLLGILDEGRGLACGVLDSLGVSLDAVRAETLRLLAEMPQTGGIPKSNGVRRYNLALPEELFDQLQARAEQENSTVVELLRRFVKLGLLAARLSDEPDSGLIVRERGVERQVLML